MQLTRNNQTPTTSKRVQVATPVPVPNKEPVIDYSERLLKIESIQKTQNEILAMLLSKIETLQSNVLLALESLKKPTPTKRKKEKIQEE